MGLVRFEDRDGVCWRVWQVDLPSARAHLMDVGFRGGWLVFERIDERERRRLPQVPDGWESLSAMRLGLLCAAATVVPAMRHPTTKQIWAVPPTLRDVRETH